MCINYIKIKDGKAYSTCNDVKKRIVMCVFDKYHFILEEIKRDKELEKQAQTSKRHDYTEKERKQTLECITNPENTYYYLSIPSLLLRDNNNMCLYSFYEPIKIGKARCENFTINYPVLEGDFVVNDDTYTLAGVIGILDYMNKVKHIPLKDIKSGFSLLLLPIASLLFFETFGSTRFSNFTMYKLKFDGKVEKLIEFAKPFLENAKQNKELLRYLKTIPDYEDKLKLGLDKAYRASYRNVFTLLITPSI